MTNTLTILLNQIYRSIDSCFGFGERIFGAFGLSLIALSVAFFAMGFVVNKFVRPFIS